MSEKGTEPHAIIPMRPNYFDYLTMPETIRSVLVQIRDGITQAKQMGIQCNYPTEVHFTIGTSTTNVHITVPFEEAQLEPEPE